MDANRIEREIVIAAPPEVVWGVVTEPEQMTRWFTDSATFEATPGSRGSVGWDGRGTYDLVIDAAEPHHRFAFRWVFPAGSAPDETNSLRVEFTFIDEGGATRLRLVESGFTVVDDGRRDTSLAEHERGWARYLGQLADYAAQKVHAAP